MDKIRSPSSVFRSPFLAGLATTYSPMSCDKVPLALRRLTAEFGMGSGLIALQKPPGRQRTEF